MMDTYDRLAALLRRQSLTAKEIAARTGCSVPTVHARLKVLARRGYVVASERVPAQPADRVRMVQGGDGMRRAHRPGPVSTRWSVK